MKININIEVSPSELIELQDVVHESAREVVTKLSAEGMAHKILEHLEEASNQVACHIPADRMETGTVIQGKPTREPEAAEPEYRVGDLVELPWEKNGYGFSDRLFSITELCDDDTVSLREIDSFPVFTMTNIPKSWIRRPRIKVDLYGDDEWITHNDADPQPTPFRPIPPCMEGKVVRMKGVGVSALTGKEVRCDTMCVVVVDDLRGHALIMSHDDLINVPTSQLQMWNAAPKE